MTEQRIVYEGPSDLAVEVATMLANAEGVDLTSSEPPRRRDAPSDSVVLTLVLDGSTDDVNDAVERVRALLPTEATIAITDR